MMTGDHAKR
jgi:hypothetical protein